MHTTYRLKASELDQRFIDGLKATYQDREIEIVVYEVDEIAYLLSLKANKQSSQQVAENDPNQGKGNHQTSHSAKRSRSGWNEAFAVMVAQGDDRLLDDVNTTEWDQTEWEW